MRRYQTGTPNGTSRSTPKLRRLIRFAQRPGPYHAVQGGIINPHRYPDYVIGTNPNAVPVETVLEHVDTADGTDAPVGIEVKLTVNPGTNKTLLGGATTTALSGSASGGMQGETIVSYSWAIVSGPNSPKLASPLNASTTVKGLVPGTYVFKLTAVGSSDNTGSATVSIIAS